MSVHSVAIEEHATGKLVEAELDDLLPIDALLDIEDAWEPSRRSMIRALRRARTPRQQWPQSLHWDWAGKSVLISLHHRANDYRAFGLRVGSEWQGAMLTIKNEGTVRLSTNQDAQLVYVDFLESAPWNWTVPAIDQVRRYAKIGPILLRFAVEQSLAEGFNGRIGLHALSQAESFYASIGMTSFGPDERKEDLTYFEFSEERASVFLKKR